LTRLRAHAPPGLVFHSARETPLSAKAQPRRAFYRVSLADLSPDLLAQLPERCLALLQQETLWVARLRPAPRRVNIRPFLDEVRVVDDRLEVAIWVTPNGSAKADEVLRLLGLETLLEQGVLPERY